MDQMTMKKLKEKIELKEKLEMEIVQIVQNSDILSIETKYPDQAHMCVDDIMTHKDTIYVDFYDHNEGNFKQIEISPKYAELEKEIDSVVFMIKHKKEKNVKV